MADFAKALSQRSKTDDLDAEVMLEFARQIPFVWLGNLPSLTDSSCALLMRRITKLASQQEQNRLHSESQSAEITPWNPQGYPVAPRATGTPRNWNNERKPLWQPLPSGSVRGIARISALHILAGSSCWHRT
jgi:hypothetical protein